MRIAVITGASAGMGKEFVRELDREGIYDQLWLIARREERLVELAGELSTPCRSFSLDLSRDEDIARYEQALEEAQPEVATLVNAAGYGIFRAFDKAELEPQLGMIDLNVRALVAVTYKTLPFMNRGGRIFQFGSLSSFQPVPYMNVYGAGKAFVLSFSRALNVELAPRGIRVMAVCPGWIKTEFFQGAVQDDTISYYNRYYEAKPVVIRALRDMKKGRDVSVLGFPVRMQRLAVKLLPHRLVMWIWCRQQGQPFK